MRKYFFLIILLTLPIFSFTIHKHYVSLTQIEFIQEKKEPYSKIIVRFDNEEDLLEFSKLIGQKLTNKTKSIWHPFKSHWGNSKNVRWFDEP